MPASSYRFIVCEGGVEVTRIFIRVSEAGCPCLCISGFAIRIWDQSCHTMKHN
jgi:hypothetical protein